MRGFPSGFLFGCATSAYQIEGGIENDWSAMGARAGRATEHWDRYEGDFDLLVDMGATAYRMSIEWARVEPVLGAFDDAVIAHYVRMIDALRARGIEPFITLLHFTHPQWFFETCPWHEPSSRGPERFEIFVRRMAEAIGDRVRFYTVLNEPSVWISAAHVGGVIPPKVRGMKAATTAMANLVRAHARAATVLRATNHDVQVGVAHNVVDFEPSRRWHPVDRIAASYVRRAYNRAFLDAIATGRLAFTTIPTAQTSFDIPEAIGTLDFLGVNYYSRVYIEANILERSVLPYYQDRRQRGTSDLGWEVHPEGLTKLLNELVPYGLPIYITENGLDDRDDTRRAAFLFDHLSAVLDAVDAGADVRGYFHWSLLDNFEWLEAYEPRFGLYRVDYDTMARRPTRAVEVFRQIARDKALPDIRPSDTPKVGVGRTPVQ